MKKQSLVITIILATATTALLALFWVMGTIRSGIPTTVLAAPQAYGTNSLTVSAVHPSAAPNDVNIAIVITGTGFTAELTNTIVLTPPAAYLGNAALEEVVFVSSNTLSATVPWGLQPGVYTLTVVNPDGGSGSLPEAFTVAEGIGVWTTGGPYGGDIRQVFIHPLTPTVVYASAYGVGLFASSDGAETWKPILVDDNNFKIAIDAVNPKEIYAGGGGYLYQSLDGGKRWNELVGRGSELHHCYVHRPVTHPNLNGVSYDAVSLCQGFIPTVDRSGIYFSNDHGTTWISLTIGLTDTNITALVIQAQDPDTMLAGTASGNLFASYDGGLTWEWVTKLDDKVQLLDFNPYEPLEAWASTQSQISNPPPKLYKSTNLTDWDSVISDPELTWGQDGWDLAFLTDTIWAASIRVYTSTDGGENWNHLEGLHTSALSLDISPGDPDKVYIGTFRQGVYRSNDSGISWQTGNQGLAGLYPSSIAVDPFDPDTVYASTEVGLLKSINGGYHWQLLDLFTGGFPALHQLATDPFKPDQVYFAQCGDANTQGWIYSCYSQDGGENWEQIIVTLPTTMTTWSGAMYVVAPHPTVPGRIFGGATVAPLNTEDDHGLIYTSEDFGESWSLVGPPTPVGEILQIAIDVVNPDLIYVATRGSGLWRSTDGGESWAATPFTDTAVVPYVVAHPSQENKVYFASSTISDYYNFVSEDAGQTWELVDSDRWFGAPFMFTPTQSPLIYAGCEYGDKLCRSTDLTSWEEIPGMIHPRAIAAGTDGERIVIYVGTPGGVVTDEELVHTSAPDSLTSTAVENSLLGGGVYRLTMVLQNDLVYLPLVER